MRTSRERMAEWDATNRGGHLSCLIPARDYNDLNLNNVELRVWLPEPARKGLEEICERLDISMTAYLIEYFVSYLFGFHELLRMRDEKTGIYEAPKRRGCAMGVAGSGRGRDEPSLGKNIFALKLFVPVMVKDRLRELATRADRTLGEYTRALICAHLFGREYGPSKLMVGTEIDVDAAEAWESSCST